MEGIFQMMEYFEKKHERNTILMIVFLICGTFCFHAFFGGFWSWLSEPSYESIRYHQHVEQCLEMGGSVIDSNCISPYVENREFICSE